MKDGHGVPLADQNAEPVDSHKAAFEGRSPYVNGSLPDSDPNKYAAPAAPVPGSNEGTPVPDPANKPQQVLPTAEDDGQSNQEE